MTKWFAALLLSTSVQAADLSHLQHIGGGEMRYLFWKLYRADLFAASRPYQPDAQLEKALRIEYYRAIEREDLLSVTLDQWQQLGYDRTEIEAWKRQLAQIWPDVSPGDSLTLIVASTGESRFYFGNQYIGAVSDKAFGTAFLDIWLSEQTSEPHLRQKLLGLKAR